jgi:3-hydroxyisobutyrate dehydrogenase-like beta-hydroxyacid dehydrogenase
MAASLVKAGHNVTASISSGTGPRSWLPRAAGEVVIKMLPPGPDLRSVYLGEGGVLGHARKGALLIDSRRAFE